ncbi:hypothetical protein ACIQ2D_15030 [Lysinibacillus sp. NPDC097287]|uniref:hypothetical protein n=1 Tax=Lysinibacillus sp. NPDC097287 TaxID=3364144 RepID=UPI003814BD16
MININTYMEDMESPFDNVKLIRIDDEVNMQRISSKLSDMYNGYCIEIIYNDKRLNPLCITTTEPWETYLCLIKNYLIAGYSEVHDLNHPIMFYFLKDEENFLRLKIENSYDNTLEYEISLPEKEFLTIAFKSFLIYLDYMKIYNPEYCEHWKEQFNSYICFIANKLNVE